MQEHHDTQLNLAGARQSTAKRVRNLKEAIAEKVDCINEKDECIDVLTYCIKGKECHIKVLNNQVQAIEAQFELMHLSNIFLPEEADNKKKSDKQQENSSLYKRLDNYLGGRGKWKRIVWELFSFYCICNHIIDETVTHIRDNVYTPASLAYIMDMHHGLNLTDRVGQEACEQASLVIFTDEESTETGRD
jgi:hypothetical protein